MVAKAVEEAPSLEDVLAAINGKHGVNSVLRAKDQPLQDVTAVSTGSIRLDMALGIGGLPLGRVVEIYGPESSGKTTLALQTMANVQRSGGTAVMIDAEHALDLDYARSLGVDTDKLIISQPDSGEQALDIAKQFAGSGRVNVIVVDSVAAMVPIAELQGEVGDSHVGQKARMMGQALRILTPMLAQNNCLLLFINQLREKVGVTYGSPETTPGGKALPFAASVRLDIRRREPIKAAGDKVIGHKTKVTVKKNKMAPPLAVAEFELYFGLGVNLEGEILDVGAEMDLVKKAGAFYSLPDGTRIGQGKTNSSAFLRDNPGLRDDLERQIRERLGWAK